MNKTDRQHVVAAFDFDGTLTTSDTLLAFIRFTHGRRRLLLGFLRYAPLLLLMMVELYPRGKAKERIFSHFYRGTSYEQFARWGMDFADVAETMLNGRTVAKLRRHQARGHRVCVVTASIEEWVRPVCKRLGVDAVLATRVEVSPDGLLTGRFLCGNCRGKLKVARLLEQFPHRRSYTLYAYGDGRGDAELLAMADRGYKVAGSWRRLFRARFS